MLEGLCIGAQHPSAFQQFIGITLCFTYAIA